MKKPTKPAPPASDEITYELELLATIDTLDLRDDDDSDAIMAKLGTLFTHKDDTR